MERTERISIEYNGKLYDFSGGPEYIDLLQNDDSFLFKQIQIYEDKKIAFDIMKTQFESSANKHIDDPSTSTSCNTDFLSQAIYEECINEEPTTDAPAIDVDGDRLIQTWSEAPIKLLISLYTENIDNVGKTLKLKTKKKLWDMIQLKMEEQGYNFTSAQVENKWKVLERNFKKKMEHNNKTGRNRVNCPYEKELGACLIKKSTVFPEYVLSSTDTGKTKTELIKDTMVIDTDTSEKENEYNSTPHSSRQKVIKKKGIAKELEESRVLKEKLEKEKLEAYNRRTEEIKRKNDLFEKFISVMTNKNSS